MILYSETTNWHGLLCDATLKQTKRDVRRKMKGKGCGGGAEGRKIVECCLEESVEY